MLSVIHKRQNKERQRGDQERGRPLVLGSFQRLQHGFAVGLCAF